MLYRLLIYNLYKHTFFHKVYKESWHSNIWRLSVLIRGIYVLVWWLMIVEPILYNEKGGKCAVIKLLFNIKTIMFQICCFSCPHLFPTELAEQMTNNLVHVHRTLHFLILVILGTYWHQFWKYRTNVPQMTFYSKNKMRY